MMARRGKGQPGLDTLGTRSYLLERDVYAEFLHICCASVGSTLGYLQLFDEPAAALAMNVWTPAALATGNITHAGPCSLDRAGPWADCLRERRPVIFHEAAEASVAFPQGQLQLQNLAAFPVWHGEALVAAVGIGEVPGGFSETLISDLEQLLRDGWPVVDDRLRDLRLRCDGAQATVAEASPYAVLESMIGAITNALEQRDEHTANHQQNVAYLSGLIADAVDLPEFERRGLVIGASLHDIGKIALPAEVLTKPGSISTAEQVLVRTHSEVGAGLFSPLALPWDIAQMIMQHHERLDGSGYPHGLERHAICEAARIIAIADTYDAMASDRPYRRSRGTLAAMETLRDGRDRLFDGFLVDAFLRVAERDPGFGGRYEK